MAVFFTKSKDFGKGDCYSERVGAFVKILPQENNLGK